MKSQKESLQPSTVSDIRPTGVPVKETVTDQSDIIDLQKYLVQESEAPTGFQSFDSFVAKSEEDSERAAQLKKARQTLAKIRNVTTQTTVRDLRLNEGMSQKQLGELVATSQSHIARIERGTENLTINTCRKLCVALGVDMNTLNKALIVQEAQYQAKS